jgi:hypothetical protein
MRIWSIVFFARQSRTWLPRQPRGARRHFEKWQAQCKLPLRDSGTAVQGPSILWREIVGYENEVIARLGRVSDLIVVARAGEGSGSSSAMALETALFDTSRPVLMVPDGTPANLFDALCHGACRHPNPIRALTRFPVKAFPGNTRQPN